MSQQQGLQRSAGEIYCRETQTLVEDNPHAPRLRLPVLGCTQWVARNGDPMRRSK